MKGVAHFATGSLIASVASAQVVQWDIERKASPTPKLVKRADGIVEEVITNQKMRGGYFASCSVGTPPQALTLQLDTGSSDIWVPASTAQVCEESRSQGPGCDLGSYDSSKSSTFEVINEDFSISYLDESYSIGDYISETFGIGDVKIPNTTMGLGLDTDIAYGLVGVGYYLNVAARRPYANLPIVMLDEGYIATNAYSLWLNDLDASTGNILFGGIDTDKYEGDLTRINVEKDARADAYTSFIVALTSLSASSSSGTDTFRSTVFPIPVILDSGTTFTYLPQELTQQIWQDVGAVYVSYATGGGIPVVPCALKKNQGYLEFGFGGDGGATIRVHMDELVLPLTTEAGEPYQLVDGPNKDQPGCLFGIHGTDGEHFLLGDSFLRSAYVVYDLENNEIGIAPTDFNSTTSNIVPFPSRGAEIPSSTPAPNQGILPQGSYVKPEYNAREGFTNLAGGYDGGVGGDGGDSGDSAASLPPALDLTQWMVMGASMCLMMFGGGLFLF